MKRLHIHIAVDELVDSIHFYSTIFDARPSIEREDYAKWDLHDPAVNFAISKRGHLSGVNHLGIEVDSEHELNQIAKRLEAAEIESSSQEGASCCYARSNKHWALDPQGIAWESFHALGSLSVFGGDPNAGVEGESSACCIPLSLSDQSDQDSAACCISHETGANDCC